MFEKNTKIVVTKGSLKGLEGEISEVREAYSYLSEDIRAEVEARPYLIKFSGKFFPSMFMSEDEIERREK